MKNKICILLCFINVLMINPVLSQDGYSSVYTVQPEDPLAVYFTADRFDVVNDGSRDVSEALQEAINQVQETVRYGVLFIPEGTYRISRTIHVWKGIRLIGYGKKRPVFLLSGNTPGFQDGRGKYMFHFCSDRSRQGRPVQDANAGTFYSGMRNINIRIERGNPAAVAVRFHVAQHCFLSHMDFEMNDGNVGVEDTGNEIEYCRFFGGDYGINTTKTSPGWQALVIDSYFEKQKKAAIRTQEAGLMLIRNHFRKLPGVVSINEGYPEELWISDSRFEDVTGPAVVISNEYNARTQINLENIVCLKVPELIQMRTSRKKIALPHKQYLVKEFTHGLVYENPADRPVMKTIQDIIALKSLPSPVPSDVPLLPGTETWVNLKTLGAKGDGKSDDTDILEQAIANHRTIYLPGGHYRVTRPIVLKEHTILIGMHPSITQIMIRDSTEAYQGVGSPLPLLETPKGGTNIVTGIGLNTSGVNPRAVAAKWMAGPRSMMNDVRFTGGHGTYTLSGRHIPEYNDNRTADGIPYRTWDSQYWSLWITEGGGGTFKDIWTPSPYASAGMYISNTSTEGRLYYMSSEHHVRYEVVLYNVSNWKFFGLQLEEESGEGPYCLPVDIRNSENLLFVNTFLYRVSRVTTPYPYAVRVENSKNLTFKGLHNYSWTKYVFENTLYDWTSDTQVRAREIALLKISGNTSVQTTAGNEKVVSPGEKIKRLAGGFSYIDGITSDSKGNVYFVDSEWQHIYRWGTDHRLSLISDMPIRPVSLACDKNDHLLIVTRFIRQPSINTRGEIGVVGFDPAHPTATMYMYTLKEVPFDGHTKGKNIFYQTTRHRNENNLPAAFMRKVNTGFISRDGVTIIPNTNDIGQTYSLKPAIPGQPFYVSTGPGLRTYRFSVSADGTLSDPHLFAENGAFDCTFDTEGNVYIPADHVMVYNRDGNLIDEIEVPERPSTVMFGGKDRDILFICAGTSLYSVKLKNKGL